MTHAPVLLEKPPDAIERDYNGALLLDRKTGRPKLKDEYRERGCIHAWMALDADMNALDRLPLNIAENLEKAREPFGPQGSVQSWEEVLYNPLADGTAVTAAAEAIMFPIFTLPANYLYPGRMLKWTVFGRQSSAAVTPGTFTFKLAYSATGLGAVVMATSGAFAPDVTSAGTNLTFMLEWWTQCRSVGTAGTGLSFGRIEWTDYDDLTTSALVANLAMRMAPAATPAVATIDTTVARSLNPTYTPSVATASMTAHMGYLEACT